MIDAQVEAFRLSKVPFVILALLLRNFKEYCERCGENSGVEQLAKASEIINETIRETKDTPARIEDSLFMILLPETLREESVNLAIRLFIAFQEFEKLQIPVSIGIVQFERTWGKEKTIKTAKQAAHKAAEIPPPSLCLYNGKENRFQSLSEVYSSDPAT